MRYQYIPYIWPLFISALLSLALGLYALVRRRSAKGATNFILSMIVVTIWSLANALEMSSVDFSTKLFWANMQYFAYCYSPVTLLALCMQFTGYDDWVRNKKVIWIAVVPTIIIVLVWTDSMHGLIRYDMRIDYSGVFPVIAKKYGPVFFIHAAYSHLLNISAWILLIKAVFIKNTVYRKQAFVLFLGMSLIVVPNILYVLGLSPIKRFDITPVFFGPAGLILAWGIFRFKLFDVIPVARATLIDIMDTGVMVLDLQDRVLDINPSFQKIVGCSASKASTRPVEEVCEAIPELVDACTDRHITNREILINIAGISKVYETVLSSFTDKRGVIIGRLVVAYDITEKKQEQLAYLKEQRKLAVIKERENLARDMHDNLGQVLGFINLQTQGIRQELINVGVEIVTDKLDKLVVVTQTAHNDIREYIRSARSAEYFEQDFISLLTNTILVFEEQASIKVKLNVPIEFTGEEIETSIQINILNIIKEALNNIRKHAKASHVKIVFICENNQLSVIVEDNGIGFDVYQFDKSTKSKFGLSIMKERATKIYAQIEIKSIVGEGTRVILQVPIKEGVEIYETETNAGR